MHWFDNLAGARTTIEAWRQEYNESRPLIPPWKRLNWIDPAAITAIIVIGTVNLFRQSLHLLFDGVPEGIDLAAVRGLPLGLPGVKDVHDLHVWAMGTAQIALTAHLVIDETSPDTSALPHQAEEDLHEHFEIRHVTLQLEAPAYAQMCALRTEGGCN